MERTFKKPKIFLFNILPIYRPGMSDVFDYGRFRAASLPSSGQRTKQNTLFVSMENICGDCLDELDLFYNFATDGDDDFSKINWVDPGTFQLTQSGTIARTTNEGWQGDGTTGYLAPGFIPSVNATSYTQQDASVFFASLTDVASNGDFEFGCNAGGLDPSLLFNARTTSDVHQGRINHPTAETRGTGVSSTGFFQILRDTNAKFFKNGSQVGTNGVFGANGVPTTQLIILANNNNGAIQSHSARKMSCFGLGSSLAGQESALYNAWNTYFTSL
jgi:hypothetical protein